MTKDEILAMEPGRELDSYIHAKVLQKRTIWNSADEDWVTGLCGEKRVPKYSTDIAAAWEVVEKLRNTEGFKFFTLSIGKSKQLSAGFILSGKTSGTELLMSAPEAICKAALEIVLKEDSHAKETPGNHISK